jgi:hypothetical protein
MDDRGHIGAGHATMTAGVDDDGRSPEDRAFLKLNGEALVIRLFAASKTLRLYDINNRATQRVLLEVMESLGRIMEREGRIFIRSSNDFLLLNEYRIPVEPQHYGPFEFWVAEMKKREVEAVEIGQLTSTKEIGSFLSEFAKVEPGENAFPEIEQRLKAAEVENIALTRYVERATQLTDVKRARTDVRQESNRVYFRTVALMGNVLRTAEEKQILQVR